MLLVAVFAAIHIADGCPVNPKPFEYIQPDGSKLILHARGDEYGTWIETEDNTIVVKGKDGFYEYATVSDSTIVASGFRYGKKTSHRAPSRNGRDQGPIGVGLPDKDSLMSVIGVMRRAAMEALNSTEEEIEDSLAGPKRSATSVKSVSPQPLVAKGTQRVLCILMQFSDRKFSSSSKSKFDRIWNTITPEDSDDRTVRDFYRENSYGQMDVSVDVIGPFTAKKPSSYYKFKKGDTKSNVKELIKEALQEAKKNGVKFRNYDVNGDYWVDAVHVVFAGYADDIEGSKIGLIHPHHGTIPAVLQTQGLTWSAKNYMITSELAGADPSVQEIAPIGTICHEYGHILGVPDFYDADDGKSGGKYPGTGFYDVMASGQWNGPDQNGQCPAHHNPFTKMYIFNWVSNPILDMAANRPAKIIMQTDKDSLYTLKSSHKYPDIYMMLSGEDDAFFLENKAHLGFNRYVPGWNKGGELVIYHVSGNDLTKDIKNNTINISYPQKCYVVNAQATSNPQEGSPASYGELYEPGKIPADRAFPGRDGSKMFFTSNSTPSATSLDGSFGGMNVCFIQRSDVYDIKFVVNPQIKGFGTLRGTGTYKVENLPPYTMIEWSLSGIGAVISGSKYSPSVTIQTIGSLGQDKAIQIDGKITSGIRRTVTLKATITSGGYSYVLSKDITVNIGEVAPGLRSAAPENYTTSLKNIESESQPMLEENTSYRVVYQNPVINTADIRVEKFENGVYVPFDGEYTLSLWGDCIAMVHQRVKEQPICTFDCSNMPVGVYQLVLHVNGKVAASSKMLKML